MTTRPLPVCEFSPCNKSVPYRTKTHCVGHLLQLSKGQELKVLQITHRITNVIDGTGECSECGPQASVKWVNRKIGESGYTCASRQWIRTLWSRYRLREDQYQYLLDMQGGRCAICASVPQNPKDMYVDHDHSCCSGTGSCGKCVRGLLCPKCNTGLGQFNDDKELLRRAVLYVDSGGVWWN